MPPSIPASTMQSFSRRRLLETAPAVALSAVIAGTHRTSAQDATPASLAARSLIFFLGDGMGQAHRDAGQLTYAGAYAPLVMNTLPVVGMIGTNSVTPGQLVTDSAAAATSYATGVKTVNGAVGVDASGHPVTNLFELAKAAGKSVGVVTTAQVTDASPAAFIAHVPDRDDQSEIARQAIEATQVDVILGGGEDYWLPAGSPGAFPDNPPEDASAASVGNQGDLIARAQELGYEYVFDADGLATATGPKLLGLFANEEMFHARSESKGAFYQPVVTLQQMTAKAIELLSQNPNGFVLFVEEEAIDEMSHRNNAPLTIWAVGELDKAVQTALDYLAGAPETLLLVTADHECGGMTIEDLATSDESGDGTTLSREDGPFPVAGSDSTFIVDWTTTNHTGVRVPLTAIGPGSETLAGYYENTALFVALVNALSLPLPAGIQTPNIPAS